MTLLLVGSKNVAEALAAVRGGADILDIKNPNEGSLGANFPWVITEVRRRVPQHIPIGASIGDFPDLPGSAALAAYGAVKAGASIVKIGLMGSKDDRSATNLIKQVARAAREANKSAMVAACAYGDFNRAGTINPLLLSKIAGKGGADIVMLDTAIKDGKTLLDFIGVEKLQDFIEAAHSREFWVALAGSLGLKELKLLRQIGPDVIGVRGAACDGGNREIGRISATLVRELKNSLRV